uniref:Uncharacterized protein n=1 Tax=viral metagenome TaxID=1070528 RepID=A0A6M3LAW9_9ZZZZ
MKKVFKISGIIFLIISIVVVFFNPRLALDLLLGGVGSCAAWVAILGLAEKIDAYHKDTYRREE